MNTQKIIINSNSVKLKVFWKRIWGRLIISKVIQVDNHFHLIYRSIKSSHPYANQFSLQSQSKCSRVWFTGQIMIIAMSINRKIHCIILIITPNFPYLSRLIPKLTLKNYLKKMGKKKNLNLMKDRWKKMIVIIKGNNMTKISSRPPPSQESSKNTMALSQTHQTKIQE